jgi:SAM-dependent methyltransferase
MAPRTPRFLAWSPAGGAILYDGCGSGRDALVFRRMGYSVTAFEASPTLASLAFDHCGLPVDVRRFREGGREGRFDDIRTCAGLRHVPMAELPEVLQRLGRALKPGGVLHSWFKYGAGEREHGGRRFTDLDEAGLDALVWEVPGLAVLETRVTRDRREGREEERWVNAIRGSPNKNVKFLNLAVTSRGYILL